MSAYAGMVAAIRRNLPAGWSFTEFEPVEERPPDATTLTLKIRSVSRLSAAPLSDLSVEWILTLTTKYTSRQTADPKLFDDLIDFLFALDDDEQIPWLAWSEATKAVGDDLERLAYDIAITSHAERDPAASA